MKRAKRPSGLISGIVAVAVGLAAWFIVDPSVARRRFALVRDKVTMIRTRVPKQIGRQQRAASAELYGIKQKVRHPRSESADEPAGIEDTPLR